MASCFIDKYVISRNNMWICTPHIIDNMWRKYYAEDMLIQRIYRLEKLIKPGKVLVVYGARRVGKTTMLQDYLDHTSLHCKLGSGDNIRLQHLFSSGDFAELREYSEGYDLIALDEAQQIRTIGNGLKILVDTVPDLNIIATGSSSFDLAGALGEPLTGRKRTVVLYPFSQKELLTKYNRYELKEMLGDFLVFGSYPEIVTARSRKKKIEGIEEIVNSYLLKDVLAFERVKSSKVLFDVLKLLAFQVGNLVSLHEIATQVKVDVKTVDRYLDILEKTFIIKKITSFSKNLRKEITSKAKYYFIDNGIRNGIIRIYHPVEDRNDVGALWENFIVMERIKKHAYAGDIPVSYYFWRTYDGKEVDFVEERNGKLDGYEIKWTENKIRIPEEWLQTYKGAGLKVINRSNYLQYIV